MFKYITRVVAFVTGFELLAIVFVLEKQVSDPPAPPFCRRTRAVFDVALKVHHNIQERDIEVGRNLGNWILRWLDRMKPSAQIRGPSPGNPPNGASSSLSMTKQVNASNLKPPGGSQISWCALRGCCQHRRFYHLS